MKDLGVQMEADPLVVMDSDHNVHQMEVFLHAMMETHQHVMMVVRP